MYITVTGSATHSYNWRDYNLNDKLTHLLIPECFPAEFDNIWRTTLSLTYKIQNTPTDGYLTIRYTGYLSVVLSLYLVSVFSSYVIIFYV